MFARTSVARAGRHPVDASDFSIAIAGTEILTLHAPGHSPGSAYPDEIDEWIRAADDAEREAFEQWQRRQKLLAS